MRLQVGDVIVEGKDKEEFDYLISKIDALRDKATSKPSRAKSESGSPEQAGRFVWTLDMGAKIRRSKEEIDLDLTYDEIIARRKEQGISGEIVRDEDRGARFDGEQTEIDLDNPPVD